MSDTYTGDSLASRLLAANAAATRLYETAKNSGAGMTPAQLKALDGHLEAARRLKAAVDKQTDASAALDRLATPADDDAGTVASLGTPPRPAPAKAGQRGRTFAQAVAAEIGKHRTINNTLSVTGNVTVPAELLAGTVAETPRARRFLSMLLGGAREIPSGEYSYLRQTSRTNNAAPVALAGLKPTSLFGVERVTEPLTTIAHLSEPIPRQYLEDEVALQQFVANELVYGLLLGLDDQIANGDGVSPNLTGVLQTSGIQTQAFATDVLTTLRKALTKLQVIDVAEDDNADPASTVAYVMSPAEWEAIELTTASGSGEFMTGGPVDSAKRTLWGVKVAVSNAVTTGAPILGRWSDAELVTRGGIQVAWTESASDDFEHNLVRFRVEGRFGLGVLRPDAFVAIDTTAP